jgi:glutathione S-transferase
MKLYFSPGACSLSPHIALREAGLAFELEQVDVRAKKTKSGADYLKVNPKGQVPALVLDDGGILTEGPAIVQYIADRKPEAKLAPAAGTREHYHFLEWLNFLTSEVHKSFSPLFKPTTPEDYKPVVKAQLGERLAYIDRHLANQPYLLGDRFTVADGYAFTLLTWTPRVGIDLSPLANVGAFQKRIAARPKVQEALKAEGLA